MGPRNPGEPQESPPHFNYRIDSLHVTGPSHWEGSTCSIILYHYRRYSQLQYYHRIHSDDKHASRWSLRPIAAG